MAGSALVGTPPSTRSDELIVKGFMRIIGVPDKDTSKGLFVPKPPPGYEYETKKPAIVGALVVMIILMFSVTALRLGLRLFARRMSWGWDDWVIIPGAGLSISAMAMNICTAVYGGGGEHVWDVTYQEYSLFMRYSKIFAILLYTSFGVVKMSIALFNLRLTALTSRPWRIFNKVIFGILLVYTLVAFFWITFTCRPVRYAYDMEYAGSLDEPAKCSPVAVTIKTLSITHSIMDFVLLSTPVVVIAKVKMALGDKFRLILLFCLGSISCVASVGRMVDIKRAPVDITWTYTKSLAWNTLDLTVSVLVASLPVLNALFPSLPFSRKSSHNRSGGSSGPSFLSSASRKGGYAKHADIPVKGDASLDDSCTDTSEFARQGEVELAYVEERRVDNGGSDKNSLANSFASK